MSSLTSRAAYRGPSGPGVLGAPDPLALVTPDTSALTPATGTGLAGALTVLAVAFLVAGSRSGSRRLSGLAPVAPARSGGAARSGGTAGPGRGGFAAAAVAAVGSALGWATAGPTGAWMGAVLGTAGGLALVRIAARAAEAGEDRAELAACWELVALCLRVGLPVAAAVAAAAEPLEGPTGARLRQCAALLALGADPELAWHRAAESPALSGFARAARRSATTGAALGEVAQAQASRLRAEIADGAQARAERAGVLVTGPLGLCFLPAFLVLGIAPVVIGLAGEALARW
jgi:hypothetical protein